jgi:hypothetical protein
VGSSPTPSAKTLVDLRVRDLGVTVPFQQNNSRGNRCRRYLAFLTRPVGSVFVGRSAPKTARGGESGNLLATRGAGRMVHSTKEQARAADTTFPLRSYNPIAEVTRGIAAFASPPFQSISAGSRRRSARTWQPDAVSCPTARRRATARTRGDQARRGPGQELRLFGLRHHRRDRSPRVRHDDPRHSRHARCATNPEDWRGHTCFVTRR